MRFDQAQSATAGRVVLIELLVASFAALLSFTQPRRIWIDEFLHFALGALPTPRAAWDVITASFQTVNHGQTGVYMLLDYFLLSAFGPSLVALRLPSLLSGVLLFFSALQLFRSLGFGPFWQGVALLAILGQDLVNTHLGEARPYIPLAASSVALLSYYVVPPENRTLPVQVVGWLGGIWGAIIHPYFSLYWPAMCVVGYAYQRLSLGSNPSWNSFVAHANWLMCLVGSALYVGVASQTWLAGVPPQFAFDPYQWLKGSSFLAHLVAALFEPWSLLLVGLGGIAVMLRPNQVSKLVAPCLLIAMSFGLALLISYISYRRNYWILPRQWIASAALAPIGVAWLLAEMSRILDRTSRRAAWVFCLSALLVATNAAHSVPRNLMTLLTSLRERPVFQAKEDCIPPTHISLHPEADKAGAQWVALAQRNIDCGGTVWPIHAQFYGYQPRGAGR